MQSLTRWTLFFVLRTKNTIYKIQDVWPLVCQMKSLQHLYLRNVTVDDTFQIVLDEICPRLTTLYFFVTLMPTGSCLKPKYQMSALKTLFLQYSCPIDVVQFLSLCPELQELSYSDIDLQDKTRKWDTVAIFLKSGCLPKLDYIDFTVTRMLNNSRQVISHSHNDLSALLTDLPTLDSLCIYQMTLESCALLEPYFANLTYLYIGQIEGANSGFWQTILTSCHQLLMIPSDCTISITDILQGEPWMCLSIRVIGLTITGQASDTKKKSIKDSGSGTRKFLYQLLERISTLKDLEEIEIFSRLPFQLLGDTELLPNNGLQLLSRLTQLKKIGMNTPFWPVLHMETGTWIRKHLGNVTTFGWYHNNGNTTTRRTIKWLKEDPKFTVLLSPDYSDRRTQ